MNGKLTDRMAEFFKLQFIKEIGDTHMRLLEGCQSLLQLSGLVSRLCNVNAAGK